GAGLDYCIDGALGIRGGVGLHGAVEEQGLLGALGVYCDVGVQGPFGDQGIQGPVEVKGPVGEQGPVGDQGLQGPVGDQGLQGPIGEQGPDGLLNLVDTSPEPAGANCSAGGVKVEVGLDDNGNGILEPSEVDATEYICHGDPSTDDQIASEVNLENPINVDGNTGLETTVEEVIQAIAPITSKAARIFYPPSIAIDASSNGSFSVNLYQQYLDQYASPAVARAGAPSMSPTSAAKHRHDHV